MSQSLFLSLKSKFSALGICYKMSGMMIDKIGKLLDNNTNCSSFGKVETATTNEEDCFSSSGDLEIIQNYSLDPETDDNESSPTYVCEICFDPKPLYDSFNVKGCAHFYCIGCTIKYIESKLEDNVTLVPCPVTSCRGVLEPDFCLDILPIDLFNKWGKALCESAVLGSEKFYCPFEDCSALLINDGKKSLRKFPCPVCMRKFCVRCKVAWHSGVNCEKFQKLEKLGEDAMLVDLAKRKKWKKCPLCNYFVEKSAGCCYVRCRCGYAFCYNCGARSSDITHLCPKCGH